MTTVLPYIACLCIGAAVALVAVWLGARIVWRLLRPEASGGLLVGGGKVPEVVQEETE